MEDVVAAARDVCAVRGVRDTISGDDDSDARTRLVEDDARVVFVRAFGPGLVLGRAVGRGARRRISVEARRRDV